VRKNCLERLACRVSDGIFHATATLRQPLQFAAQVKTAMPMNEIILITHVLFGMGCILTTLWIFVDVLHASAANLPRIRSMCRASAVVMWLAFLIGGYWYVSYYKVDKALILKGPWPFAHNFIMETKEHLVITLLLVVTYLPIAAAGDLVADKGARRVLLWATGLAAVLALLMDLEGGLIALGVKVASHVNSP